MLFSAFVLSAALLSASSAMPDSAAFVNPWIGTEGTGHTTIAAAYPLGMVQAGPDTGTESWDYASGYRNGDTKLCGFSQNHLNGTGVPELGDLLILPFADSPFPVSRSRRQEISPNRRLSAKRMLWQGCGFPSPRSPASFDKSSEVATPGYYAVTLGSGIRCEAAASQRCAVWRFTYPDGANAKLLVDMQWGLVWEKMDGHVKCANVEISNSNGQCPVAEGVRAERRNPQIVTGWAETKSWTERRWNFALEADADFTVVKGDGPRRFALDFGKAKSVTVRIALSTTDEDGARRNLSEVRGKTLEQVAAEARDAWNGYLSRVEISGADSASHTNVYTALYHLFWQPNDISDIDGAYRGADGKIARVEKGHRYFSTLSFWDTYRAAHPLYAIIAPELVDDFVRTAIAHWKSVGYLPVWPVWGRDTHCMVANHCVPVLVEAVKKGLTSVPEFDVYAAIRATLRESHPGKPKEDWDILDKYGFYPYDLVPEEGVSRTVEGSYDDWCAAQLAKLLGLAEDEKFFRERSGTWRNVFDPETKSMRGRASDGSWRTPFDPSALFPYGVPRDISEANANQYAWHVQHDPSALAEAMGGRDAALAKLEEHFVRSAPGGVLADVTGLVGEYAHGNEPGHHVPYLFSLWGRPERTAETVREICDRFYRPAPDGLCGNDDCGQMSAWYLFSAMGFYPVEPASGEFVLGAPQLDHATIHLSRKDRKGHKEDSEFNDSENHVNPVGEKLCASRPLAAASRFALRAQATRCLRRGRISSLRGTQSSKTAFTVISKNLSRENKYVKSVTLNGRRLGSLDLTYADVMNGGELVFEMSGKPFDVVVVGGTSAGIAAAVQATRMGARTVVLEATRRIGGMTAGGSGQTDIGDTSASAASAVLESWERKEGLRIERGAALDRGGVETGGGRILSVRTKDGRVWRGDVFIDATCEGEVHGKAGVKGWYMIDCGAIVPKRGECANLLVPVSLSATRIASGSIRMEPAFFAAGQAAGAAAAIACAKAIAVQDVDVSLVADARRDIPAEARAAARAYAGQAARKIGDARLARMFVSSFMDTIERTVDYRLAGGRDDTYVITGDIDAMWLRDSCAQVWPYLPLARGSDAVRRILRGTLNRAFANICIDPYANAFYRDGRESPWNGDLTDMRRFVHERKWEIDSLAYPLRLAHGYWQATHDATAFGDVWREAVGRILDTYREQQRKGGDKTSYSFKRRAWTPFETLSDGIGAPVKPVGMVASSFRASDDACQLPFNVPENIFAADALSKAATVLREANHDGRLASECEALAREIRSAVESAGIVGHPEFGRVYAYEVDGFGGRILMDDANAPSLLSIPYLCAKESYDAEVAAATRRMVLSGANPWFFRGAKGEGIGSPHTGRGRIWPMSVAVRALTSSDKDEIARCIAQLADTTGGTGAVHESHSADDDRDFTRGWFAWADGLFAEAVLHALDMGVDFNKNF